MPSIAPDSAAKTAPSMTDATDPNSSKESATPDVMYSWRSIALDQWISKKTQNDSIPLTMEMMLECGHLDQYHYLGLDANDDIIKVLGCEKGRNYLDVGSGIGGPGRYIVWKSGCGVHGIDIQDDLVVTTRLGLENTTFATHDITSVSLEKEKYDGWYSILVFLHIPREPRLQGYKSIAESMKTSDEDGGAGGLFCIEDYVLYDGMEGKMTSDEKYLLEEVIGAVYVPTVSTYKKELEECGFEDIEFEDLTAVWTKWTVIRRDEFLKNREKQVALQGEAHVTKMETFYKAPPALFESGKLAGFRITGRKKGSGAAAAEKLAKGRALLVEKKTNEMSVEAVQKLLEAQKTVAVE